MLIPIPLAHVSPSSRESCRQQEDPDIFSCLAGARVSWIPCSGAEFFFSPTPWDISTSDFREFEL